ncbi:MAG: putative amidase [Paenibacillaceae bacterium]|jgi:cell wall-associated NlpC family hydrolase|nr:putative amidase [Paenibacillaceae bacterium]
MNPPVFTYVENDEGESLVVWRPALYDYVHFRNQISVQPSKADADAIFADRSLGESLIDRAQTIHEWYRERGWLQVQNETRLKLLRVEENSDNVYAEIELKRTVEHEMVHMLHTEQRTEREQVWLTCADGGHRWQVAGVRRLSEENLIAASPPDPVIAEAARAASQPYLNMEMLRSPSPSRAIPYNRRHVQRYADEWWNRENPQYLHFEVDCSNFVSQCIRAGGAPMSRTGRRDAGWWYVGKQGGRELWSYSWAVANSLYRYLSTSRSGMRAEIVGDPLELTIGDVISYDWDGTGKFQHSTIVAATAADGMPLVNAHTVESYHRYWDYRDSYAWTPQTQYRFFHIADEF